MENLKKTSNKENYNNQIDSLLKTLDSKKQNIIKMSTATISLKERVNEFQINNDMADSRTAYALSLYSKISNITWDYKVQPGKIAGCKNLNFFFFFLIFFGSILTHHLFFTAFTYTQLTNLLINIFIIITSSILNVLFIKTIYKSCFFIRNIFIRYR
jgi:hypothetical protein